MTNFKLIYEGDPENFNWVGFGSGSGTNLRECAKVVIPSAVFSDKPSAGLLDLTEFSDVEKIVLNGYQLCGSWKKAQGNKEAEAEYWRKSEIFNRIIVDKLHEHEDKIEAPIDLIVLGGYMRLIGDELLEAYEDRIINVHPADLSILDNNDNCLTRKYIGEDAVYDAIKAGERYTKSSVIMVDSGIDHGEILTQGPELEVRADFLKMGKSEREYVLREVADTHQDLQKKISDWPALTMALKLISEGRVGLGIEKEIRDEWRRVYIDDKMMEYAGLQVK